MSHDERLHILQMVQDGTITPAEAETLLAALEPPEPEPTTESAPVTGAPDTRKKKKRSTETPPDMQHLRRYWEYPFLVGLIMLGVAGLCASNTPYALLIFCGWTIFVISGLIALIGWFSQWSPWVHVRIRESDGSRIAFSLPMPLGLLGIMTDIAHAFVRRFADQKTADNVAMAASFLTMLEDESFDEPITIDVEEDDGDHIQVFFG